MSRAYFDHNATTPPDPAVIEAVARALAEDFGNASSVHHFGQRAKALLDEARSAVGELIGAEPAEIVFTSGGTESDNLALRGAAEALEASGKRHIVTSSIEHEAVLNTVKALVKRGWTSSLLPVDATGIVAPGALAAVMTRQTAIVSLILLTLSAHKFNGPKGAGALWIRRGTRLVSTMTGGKHERNRRGGTENVPGIAGMGVAARLAKGKRSTEAVRIGALRDRLEAGILQGVSGTIVNGAREPRVPNTTNISFDGVEAESLLIALDLEGYAVSTGSACSSGTLEPSHVLRAMNLPSHRTQNSIRFSLGAGNTQEQVDGLIAKLPAVVDKLRRLVRR